jgi:hypothetical protein
MIISGHFRSPPNHHLGLEWGNGGLHHSWLVFRVSCWGAAVGLGCIAYPHHHDQPFLVCLLIPVCPYTKLCWQCGVCGLRNLWRDRLSPLLVMNGRG